MTPRPQTLCLVAVVALSQAVHIDGRATVSPAADAGRAGLVAPIDRVVVFADRAEVRRTTTARCAGDVAAVVFSDLPASLDARTLRAEASGADTVGVATAQVAQTLATDERVRALQDELRAIDIAIADQQRALADADERMRSLQGYGAWFRTAVGEELRQARPDIVRFEQLLTTLTTESQSHATASVARTTALRELQRRRQRVVNRLSHLGADEEEANPRVTATVTLRCARDPSPTVWLSYVVPGAGWQPEYDLRFTSTTGKKTGEGTVTLTVAGVITQATGEDWLDAELWLSTAKPRLGGQAPMPGPLWLRAAPETRGRTLVEQQEERADELGRGDATLAAAPRAATLDDGGKAFVLKLPRRVSVRADGRPYWFPVDDVKGKAMAALVAVPSLTGSVHRAVAFKNPAAFPLLAGTVHVFRGATFVGDQGLEYRAPGEPVELSLGIDDDIALERVDLLAGLRGSTFFSGQQTIAHAMRTRLQNRSLEDIVVEVREQIPVTKTSEITVSLQKEKTTGGFMLDGMRGHVVWQVALKAGAREQRDLAFTIALPKDWKVN